MLHSKLVIKKVIESLKIIKINKIILDPVMIAKGGARLVDKDAIKIMKKNLINQVTLITPNLPEAEVLTGIRIRNKSDMIVAGKELIKLGAKNVLIKGGQLNDEKVEDIFLNKKEFKVFINKNIIQKIHMELVVRYQVQLPLFLMWKKH